MTGAETRNGPVRTSPRRVDDGPTKVFMGRVVDVHIPDRSTSALGLSSLCLRGALHPVVADDALSPSARTRLLTKISASMLLVATGCDAELRLTLANVDAELTEKVRRSAGRTGPVFGSRTRRSCSTG